MEKKKWIAIVPVALMVAALIVGCDTTTTTNTNTNSNANNANSNANANIEANKNTNANTERTINANITREEYEKEKTKFTEEAKRLGRTIGSGAEDGWLWTKTRAALATADDLQDSTINVDVDNNVVTLSGTVANKEQKAKAEKVAKGIEGVKSVKNNLTVSGDANSNAAPKKK